MRLRISGYILEFKAHTNKINKLKVEKFPQLLKRKEETLTETLYVLELIM
jgi:hypothetical protein